MFDYKFNSLFLNSKDFFNLKSVRSTFSTILLAFIFVALLAAISFS
jgi:hypothetical protein